MKKVISFILVAMIIALTATSALAHPGLACIDPNCPGSMSTVIEESQYGDSICLAFTNEWNQTRNVWVTFFYQCIPTIKKTYMVCNLNPSHKKLMKTEYYTKYVLYDVQDSSYPVV